MAGMISIPVKGNIMDTDRIAADLEGLLLETVLDMEQTYQDQLVDWQEPPIFTVEFEAAKIGLIAIIETKDQLFQWVNDGTGQAGGNRSDWYPIYPVTAPAIAYPRLFDPKTTPNSINRQPHGKGKHGEYLVRPMVFHPGITPRHFDEDISEMYEDIFEKRVRDYFLNLDWSALAGRK